MIRGIKESSHIGASSRDIKETFAQRTSLAIKKAFNRIRDRPDIDEACLFYYFKMRVIEIRMALTLKQVAA